MLLELPYMVTKTHPHFKDGLKDKPNMDTDLISFLHMDSKRLIFLIMSSKTRPFISALTSIYEFKDTPIFPVKRDTHSVLL